jgi:hypothetical protein
MATITVSGINEQSAPSPIQLRSWQHDWAPQLPGLTAWTPNPPSTTYSCTTAAGVAATRAVVDGDLTRWVEDDPGHRHYSVTQSEGLVGLERPEKER